MRCIPLLLALLLPLNAQTRGDGAPQNPIASAWEFRSSQIDDGVVRDLRGEHHATITGPVRGTERYVALNGQANKVTAATRIQPTDLPRESITLEALIRVDAPAEWGGMVCCLEDNGPDENGFILGYRGTAFMFGIATEAAGKLTYLTGTRRMRESRWNHVIGTYDGTTMRLYVDGELDAESTTQSGPIKYKPHHTLALAAYHDKNEYYGLTGLVRELSFTDVAITAAQVQSRWVTTQSKTPETVHASREPTPEVSGWPGSMRDVRRSGVSPELLSLPLRRAWTHRGTTPRSAWPPPAKGSFWQRLKDIKPRNVWDNAYHPVIVDGHVLYGSSWDRVRCLRIDDGRERWSFKTGGPVRFAPFVYDGRAFFGSDDGHVYCVDVRDGQLVWKRRLAPSERLIPGNGRLISPWPVRTGVAVERGVVYATCGLFPREGCWVMAMNTTDGSAIWSTKVDSSPQGYLLLSDRAVYVPTGRGTPFAVARDTGAALGNYGGPGGAYALVAGETLTSGSGNTGELAVSNTFGKDQLAQFAGNRMIVTPGMSFLVSDTHLSALDRERYLGLLPKLSKAKSSHQQVNGRYRNLNEALKKNAPIKSRSGATLSKAQLETEIKDTRSRLLELGETIDSFEADMGACVPWKVPTTHKDALVATKDMLFAGGDGEVAAYDIRTGVKRWSHAVEGKALAIAVAEGRLVVGTSTGAIITFCSSGLPVAEPAAANEPPTSSTTEPMDGSALPQKGFIVAVDYDREIQNCVATSPFAKDDLHRLPDRFANAVIIPNRGALTDEVRRIVRPWNGAVFIPEGTGFKRIWARGPLAGSGSWTHMYADPANTACSGDELVSADLQLQWFGGPGPRPMIDRHLRTTPPLFRDGRLFIPGHDVLIAVDGCNGTILWQRPVAGLSRTGAPYDGGHMAIGPRFLWIADRSHCHALDPDSGETVRSVPTGPGPDGGPAEWGWLCKTDDALFGSARRPGTAITSHGRTEVSRQYGEEQTLVTSHTLFREGGWRYEGGAVLNSTLTLIGDRLWFVEGRSENAVREAGGQVKLAEFHSDSFLVCLDAATGAQLLRVPFPKTRISHSLFLAGTPEHLVATGSFTKEIVSKRPDGTESKRLQTWYEVFTFDQETGALSWGRDHSNNVGGSGGDHGEQVHHPVLRDGLLFVEPIAYHLKDGERWKPDGKAAWYMPPRRGCGAFSASDQCLYFRNHNPIALPIAKEARQSKITAVTRPGCWISILPVGGMVLLPEASSGCVCSFPIQTSLGFVPRR